VLLFPSVSSSGSREKRNLCSARRRSSHCPPPSSLAPPAHRRCSNCLRHLHGCGAWPCMCLRGRIASSPLPSPAGPDQHPSSASAVLVPPCMLDLGGAAGRGSGHRRCHTLIRGATAGTPGPRAGAARHHLPARIRPWVDSHRGAPSDLPCPSGCRGGRAAAPTPVLALAVAWGSSKETRGLSTATTMGERS
jgi:hypothetical protein